MSVYTCAFSKHAVLERNVEDRVYLTLGFATMEEAMAQGLAGAVTYEVINRGSEALYFDFTYPDGSEPPPAEIMRDAVFVVLPGHPCRLKELKATITCFTLISGADVPYSVQAWY